MFSFFTHTFYIFICFSNLNSHFIRIYRCAFPHCVRIFNLFALHFMEKLFFRSIAHNVGDSLFSLHPFFICTHMNICIFALLFIYFNSFCFIQNLIHTLRTVNHRCLIGWSVTNTYLIYGCMVVLFVYTYLTRFVFRLWQLFDVFSGLHFLGWNVYCRVLLTAALKCLIIRQ